MKIDRLANLRLNKETVAARPYKKQAWSMYKCGHGSEMFTNAKEPSCCNPRSATGSRLKKIAPVIVGTPWLWQIEG